MAGKRKQHLNINSTQLEVPHEELGAMSLSEDFDSKMNEAQKQLELLQNRQQEIERQKTELASLNAQKQEFLNGQIEMGEKLSTSLTSIDRELYEMQQEIEDLQQTRECFAQHMDKIDRFNPESWAPEQLSKELQKAVEALHCADDEFNQAAQHFSDSRSRGIFGGMGVSVKKDQRNSREAGEGVFLEQFKQGLAFNFSVVIAIVLLLVAYLIKSV